MIEEYSATEVIIFIIMVAGCLWADLHAHKSDEAISFKNATFWSIIWILLSLIFAGYIAYSFNVEKAEIFLTGYLLEKTLSIDNLFVIMAIFNSFSIKDTMQHRVLYYGILGALVMRLIFIAIGTSLVKAFGAYALSVFGIFILWTAWKMWKNLGVKTTEIQDYSQHWSIKFTSRFIPIHPKIHGHDFFVKISENNRSYWKMTPLFLCLIVIELSDIMFAFDSIPAILAVTQEPFLIYTSNIFAILGLRSLYFLLSAAKKSLHHLEKMVIIILAYIGIKMLLDVMGIIHINPVISLVFILVCLSVGILASLFTTKTELH